MSVTLEKVDEDRYNIKAKAVVIGKLRIKKFPYCSGLSILCDLMVFEDQREKGYGSLIMKAVEAEAKSLKYKYILCTDVETNVRMRKLLIKRDWFDLLVFRNINTDNIVNLSCIKL